MYRSLILFIACISSAMLFGQNTRQADSLERIAKSQKDTELIKTYNELTWQYRTIDASKSIAYGNKAITLSRKLHFDKGLAQAYNDLGIIYFDRQAFDTALDYYNKAMAIRKGMGDKLGMAKLYNKIGILHQKAGRFDAAMENQHLALSIFEKENNAIGVSYSLNNIGILDQNMGRYDEAIEYQKRSIAIKEKIGDKIGVAGSYVNVGNIYTIKKDYKTAADYFTRGVQISRLIGDKEYLGNALNNLARLSLLMKAYDKALSYARESYVLRQGLGDTKGVVSCLNNIGEAYLALGKYDSAQTTLKTALDLAQARESSRPDLPAIYQSLSKLYETKGAYPQALEMHRKYAELKDSIYTSELGQRFAELQTKYETLQKEKQIAAQRFEISRSRYLMYGGAAAFLLLSLLGISYYRRYRLKQRTLMQAEIHRQQELATKAVIEAEETERQRIAKDLHDGIGQMMSAARMNLSAYEASASDTNRNGGLHKIISLVDDSCKELRAVSHNMMPAALVKGSLAAALQDFCDKLDGKTMKVQMLTEGFDRRIDANTEAVLYRILQECMNNVIKHSGATRMDISLVRDEDGISATVEDNGKGFDITAAANGIGMKNIRTRMEYLKGTIDIDTAPGKGTAIALFVPVRKTETA